MHFKKGASKRSSEKPLDLHLPTLPVYSCVLSSLILYSERDQVLCMVSILNDFDICIEIKCH